ncbi:hypothetical protein [Brevibacillus reuszeri]|uniref:hypothetical protein n=1 Tax=Brevibacillus reuszeri TaxID=54915 RepID=UPI0006731726|nr:hypothetical protein [Brevibacillus reuszeri]MED1859859.1 hypothetical protein [Brevibacillus reuszeri]
MDFAKVPETTKKFFTTDVAAKRLLLTPMWNLPPGVNLLVEACNNAYDAVPTWEDATLIVKMGRAYLFTNTSKSAAKWGVNFRFRIEKGSALFPISFKGVGGAFDEHTDFKPKVLQIGPGSKNSVGTGKNVAWSFGARIGVRKDQEHTKRLADFIPWTASSTVEKWSRVFPLRSIEIV